MSISNQKQLRVLVSSYACAPGRGAEPGVGWNVVANLVGTYGHKLVVITRTKHRASIEASDDPRVASVKWIYVDPPEWIWSWKRGAWGLKAFYVLWQRRMHEAAAHYLKNNEVDVVHHLTFGNILPATPLADFDYPLVIGPVGGAEMSPEALVGDLSPRLWIRDRLRAWLYRFGSRWKSTREVYEKCRVALGATEASVAALSALGAADSRLVPQSGCGDDEVDRFAKSEPLNGKAPKGPVHLVTASRLVHWKGVDLAVSAFADAVKGGLDAKLTILQEGREKKALQKLVRKLGVEDRVVFTGFLESLEDVYRCVRTADALVHPAINEAFGQSVLESLALGRQVICLDWAGPGMIVTEECGIKVKTGNRATIVTGLSAAMSQLVERRESWEEIEKAAVERAKLFSWERVAREVNNAYQA